MSKKAQLEFKGLETFFLNRKDHQSCTLELVDQLPFFRISHKRYLDQIDFIESKVIHRERVYETELTPAIWKKKNKAGKFDKFIAFPNRREEVVMDALRFLACQEVIKFEKEKDENLVTITFSLDDLRKHLIDYNHGWKWEELKESITILSRSRLEIESGGLCISGNLLNVSTSSNQKEVSKYRATFHPLISQAILSDAHYPINYKSLTDLKSTLARWIYKRLVHEVRNAEEVEVFNSTKGKGLQFTYDDAMNFSGITPSALRQENYRTIRKALKELCDNDLIHNPANYQDHPYETVKHKVWKVFPSSKTMNTIFEGHKRGKTAREKLEIRSHVVKDKDK